MAITIQLSRQSDIVSDLIADFTHAWPSHVDIVSPLSGWLLGARSDVCAGVPAGVQLRPPNYASFTRTERISFIAPAPVEEAFGNFLQEQLGKPYAKIAIAGLALDRDWRDPNHWFCSELFMAAAEVSGLIRKITSPLNFISPRDVLILGEALGTPA
jgi:hypothetical protein